MHALLVAAAALWGLASGAAVPRAAHRLAVEPGQQWRPGERPGWRGWIGPPATVRDGRPAVLAAAICAALAQRVGARPELAVWLLLVPLCVLLARVDVAVRRLPDVLTVPAAAGTALLLGAAALFPGHTGSWPRALLGALVLGAGYFVLVLANPGGMGLGDVKLAPTIGLALGWYGWPVLFVGTFLGFALGGVTGLVLLTARRADRRTAIAFGPFMLLGALLGVLLGAG
ncbi:prepilin peptidase [Streptantibioticus rubrisoli]|uniref:A24 family peptidase n=1 Tax=Streptantibioticus rubrisoli TaxID=1387313 RepID=A0ABT1PKY6_9ACTN|nr:A24 family peptidase [Streptantibioticus rubrisoli]MCQ4046031.1 A24 family peptidase [Streptantibioticus rubrisoli]